MKKRQKNKKNGKKNNKKWQKMTKNDKKCPTLKKKWDKSGIKSGIFCSFFYFLSHFLKKNEKFCKKTLLKKTLLEIRKTTEDIKKMRFFAIFRVKISHFPKNDAIKNGIFFGVFWCFLVKNGYIYPTFPLFPLFY